MRGRCDLQLQLQSTMGRGCEKFGTPHPPNICSHMEFCYLLNYVHRSSPIPNGILISALESEFRVGGMDGGNL